MRSRAIGFLFGMGLLLMIGHAFANNPSAVFQIEFVDQGSDCPSIFTLSVNGITCNSTTITGSGTTICTYSPNPQNGGPGFSLIPIATPGATQNLPAVPEETVPEDCTSSNAPVFRVQNWYNQPRGGVMLKSFADQSSISSFSSNIDPIFMASPTIPPVQSVSNLCARWVQAFDSIWHSGALTREQKIQNITNAATFQVDLSGQNQEAVADWVKSELHCIPSHIYLSCPSLVPRVDHLDEKYYVKTNITADNLGFESKPSVPASTKCVDAPHSVLGPSYQVDGIEYYTTTQALREEGIANNPNFASYGVCAAIFVPGGSSLARTLIDGFSSSCSYSGFLNSSSTVLGIMGGLNFTPAIFKIKCTLNQGALSCDGPTLAD